MLQALRHQFLRISGKVFLRADRFRGRFWQSDLRLRLGEVYPTTILEFPLDIPEPEAVHFGSGARISWFGAFLVEGRENRPEIRIGDGSYLGNRCRIVARGKVSVGENVLVADDVFMRDSGGGIEIGDGAWIGENVRILGDVRIGRNCVIGANAVVRRDIPAFSVAVGLPARVIKRYHFGKREWEKTDGEGEFVGERLPEVCEEDFSGSAG